MKEFLNPDQGYKLVCCEVGETPIPDNWIEVPEGAEIACDWCNDCDFYKLDGDLIYTFENGNWELCEFNKDHFFQNVRNILWQREKVEVESEKLDTDAMLADIDVQIATHSQHGHYFKDVRDLNVIDVYQVLRLFNVTDPCLQHIVKKALVAGGRGHKDFERDLKDIHDTSKRALEINNIKH